MFIRKLFHISMLFETPEGGSGSVGTVAPGTGVQPSQGQGEGSGGDFWGFFPGVPEDQRGVLEPHLKGVQGEVTKLQQQQAAFKPLTDAGYEPQQLQGLVAFDQRFQSQPIDVWVEMADMLQKNGVLHESLDLEAVKAIAMGEDTDEPVDQGTEEELPPAVAAHIQRLEAELAKLSGGLQQRDQRQQTLVQDRLLSTQKANMRKQLVEAGYAEEQVTDETLNSFILTHRGNVPNATKALIEMRSGILKGFTQNRNPANPLETRNGGPAAPKVRAVRDPDDPFEAARPAAHNRLARANRDRVQG